MMKQIRLVAPACFCLVGICAYGSNLIWTGTAAVDGGKWGSGANWTNSAGASLSFATGDNALFGDSATVRSVNLSATVMAGDILFENDADYTLVNTAGGKIGSASTFIKRGAGALILSCNKHTFTNDVRIEKGTVRTTQPNAETNSPVGLATVSRQIYVGTNATLRFNERNTMGAADLTNLVAEIYVDQGLFELGYPGVANKGINTVGALTLNDGTFAYTNLMGNTTYGVLKVCRTFRLLGTQPYYFRNYGSAGCFMLLNSSPYTEFNVADITGNTNVDATLEMALKEYAGQPGGLIKTGAGTLRLATSGSTFKGNVEVREGELIAAAPKIDANNAETVLGNAKVSRSIYVGTNAVLTFSERNTLGMADATNPQVAITVDHATLQITVDNFTTTFGPLTLDSSVFTYKGGLDAARGSFRLGGKLTLKGETPFTFGIPAGSSFAFINLNDSPLTEINVEDITGTPAADASFWIPFKDFASSNSPTYAAGFVKTGPGTLLLTNAASTFTGDLVIREGLVVADMVNGNNVSYSPLGNPMVERRITVSTNATLQLRQRNTLSAAAAPNSLKAEIYVDHGTLLLGDAGVIKGVNTLGSLTLNDGTLNYTNMYNEPYGFLKVARVFRLQGTAPYDFAGSALAGAHMLLNSSPLTTFEVEDITGDASTDATFGFPFKNQPSVMCGLVKSGAGTMRVTAVSAYTGDTLVSNGVLRVDGSLATSREVIVAGDGWLGGTGTVKDVTVEAGCGFAVSQGQAKPLTVTGSLTLEGGGTVRIQNPSALPGREVHVAFADVAGEITGTEHLADWTVEIEGASASSNYRVQVKGTKLTAGFAPKGVLISLR